MTTPTISVLRTAGYRMSANASDAVVSRCATQVKACYLLHYVEESDITAATAGDEIGKAWLVLTYLRYLQDVEFGTRTGGEKKRFEYGDHLSQMKAIKAEAAVSLQALEAAATVTVTECEDVCAVWFKTQLFH